MWPQAMKTVPALVKQNATSHSDTANEKCTMQLYFPFRPLFLLPWCGIESESYSSNITRYWKPVDKCRNIHTNLVTETGPNMIDMPAMDDHESTNMIDIDLKAKMSRSGQQTPPTTNHRQVGRSSGSTLLESFFALTVAAVLGFALH
uniref:Uncharacterized protein n=1 Tax=Anopheles minimus TaxID=112268 RepID=A0A182WEN0_9DIPT